MTAFLMLRAFRPRIRSFVEVTAATAATRSAESARPGSRAGLQLGIDLRALARTALVVGGVLLVVIWLLVALAAGLHELGTVAW